MLCCRDTNACCMRNVTGHINYTHFGHSNCNWVCCPSTGSPHSLFAQYFWSWPYESVTSSGLALRSVSGRNHLHGYDVIKSLFQSFWHGACYRQKEHPDHQRPALRQQCTSPGKHHWLRAECWCVRALLPQQGVQLYLHVRHWWVWHCYRNQGEHCCTVIIKRLVIK